MLTRQSHPPLPLNVNNNVNMNFSSSTPPRILNKKIIHRLHNHHLSFLEMQQQQKQSFHPDKIIPEEGKKQKRLWKKNKQKRKNGYDVTLIFFCILVFFYLARVFYKQENTPILNTLSLQ